MDELSTHALREAATAANLRRALGAVPPGEPPAALARLLGRLGELATPARPSARPLARSDAVRRVG